MQHLRAFLRLMALTAVVLLCAPLAFGARVFYLLGARRRGLRWAAFIQALWGRWSFALMGGEFDLEEELPRGHYLVVSNHLSYVDIPVLSALFAGRFVAKSEISGWPVMGPMAKSSGTIFINRARGRDLLRVGEEMQGTLDAGVSVVIFPEGGAHRGRRVERFHSPLFEGAVAQRSPCLPVAISYETPGSPHGPAWTVCWWGDMGMWRHLWRLLGLPRVRCRVRFAPEPIAGESRKELTSDLERAVTERFLPVAQAPAPPDFPWPEMLREHGELSGS